MGKPETVTVNQVRSEFGLEPVDGFDWLTVTRRALSRRERAARAAAAFWRTWRVRDEFR